MDRNVKVLKQSHRTNHVVMKSLCATFVYITYESGKRVNW
jgi:hypothetical protein